MQTFKESGIPEQLYHRLEQIGLITPTPIQVQAIPPALEGRDILGTAQTGTGKTAAYGIPIITQIINTPDEKSTALILLPTRELAAQVIQSIKQFIGNGKISTALLIGGEAMPKQLRQLRTNPRVIVGTPGRINDHLNRRTLKLHNTNFFVLDEVDRMLDMGFGIQLDEIASYFTSEKRQTLMFSATLPSNIKKLSNKYLVDPVRVSVGATHAPATRIKQEHVKLSHAEKQPRLLEELHTRTGSILVFVKTKHGADKMANQLRKEGHKSDALHGDLRQGKRNRVIADFRKQNYRILVATDVAARGLDIPHIEHVINYDLPQCPEDYIHRIGRTARAGAEGEALSFISSADYGKWRAIERLMNPDAKRDDDDNFNDRKSRRKRGGKYKPRGSENRNSNRGGDRPYKGRSDNRDGNSEGRNSRRGDKPYRDRSDNRDGNSEGRNSRRGDKPYRDRSDNRDGNSEGRNSRRGGDKPYRDRSDNRDGNSENRNSRRGDKPYRDRSDNRDGNSEGRNSRRGGDKPYRDRSDNRDGNSEGRNSRRGGDKPYRDENSEGRNSRRGGDKPYRDRSDNRDGNSEGRNSRGGENRSKGYKSNKQSRGGNEGLYRKRKRKPE